MPSLEDVANELKALLEDIRTNTTTINGHAAAIETTCGAIDAHVVQLDNHLQTGFTNLAQGIQVLVALGVQANQLAAFQIRQNETTNCWLGKIAGVLCDIKRNTDREVRLQEGMSDTLTHLDRIAKLVHSRETVELANDDELARKLEKCCPKREEPPAPCFEPCESPREKLPDPVRSEWRPVEYPKK